MDKVDSRGDNADVSPDSGSAGEPSSWLHPLGVTVVTTAAVTGLSYLLPLVGFGDYAATAVGMGFFAAAYWVALRHDEHIVRHFGLSLGGLLEPRAIEIRRVLADGLKAVGWGLGLAAIFFPPFWIGYVLWWQPSQAFSPAVLAPLLDEAPGQLLVIALPEEAFYRGYLQRAFDDVWKPRVKILGAEIGFGLVASAALFALGHLLTEWHPNRLAVFFPALLFGWIRARTGGIGAGVVFHALCNLFASFLARSYGFAG